MRTRTRLSIEQLPALAASLVTTTTINCAGVVSNTANSNIAGSAALTTHEDRERISDSSGYSRANTVFHRRVIKDIYPYTASWFPWYGTGGRVSYGDANTRVAQASLVSRAPSLSLWDTASNVSVPQGFTISAPVIDEGIVARNLLDDARQLKADVILNIVEANQIWPSIRSLARCLPEMARHWNKIRKLLRTSGSSYLAWKFGVSPIIGDLSNIAKYAPQMRKDYQRFRDGEARRYSRKFACPVSFTRIPTVDTANGVPAAIQSYQGYMVRPAEIRYVLVVQPNAPIYQSEAFAKLDFALRRFGTSPARLLWERIPFSFIVDWFVDVRGACDALDKAVGVTPYKVRSFTKSYQYATQQDMFLEARETCPSNGPLLNTKIGSILCKHYERSVVSTNNSISWNPRFGKNQAGITAALIAANLRKLRGS